MGRGSRRLKVATRRVLTSVFPPEVAKQVAEASGAVTKTLITLALKETANGAFIPLYVAPAAPADGKAKKEGKADGKKEGKADGAASGGTQAPFSFFFSSHY